MESSVIRPWPFYLRSTGRFATRILGRRVLKGRYERTVSAVEAEYEPQRQAFRERFKASDWDLETYVMEEAGSELQHDYYFANVLDGDLVIGAERTVRSRLLDDLVAAVEHYGARSVIEVGCGTGRNLLHLKSVLPDLDVAGLELSAASVSVAQEAAERYGLDLDVRVQDATQPWPIEGADLIYSICALEMMPAHAPAVARQMYERSAKAVVMYEPLPDLWSGPAAVPSRLRRFYLDRLRRGAFDALPITSKQLMPAGTALNRVSKIVIEK